MTSNPNGLCIVSAVACALMRCERSIQMRSTISRLLSWTLLTRCDLHKIRTKEYLVRYHVAIQDLTDALIHSREGRTVHGHTWVGVILKYSTGLRAQLGVRGENAHKPNE